MTPGNMNGYPAITSGAFRDVYHPTKLPQITMLKITGINNPFNSKSLNSGLPMNAFTAVQSQRVGTIPNKNPFKMVGFFIRIAKIIPQIPPQIRKSIAAIKWSAIELAPNSARYISTKPGFPMPIAFIIYMITTKITAPRIPAMHPFFIRGFILVWFKLNNDSINIMPSKLLYSN
jgi:hypothetical protein